MKRRILIMGAAGRDFHNFNVVYRDNPKVHVAAFTAAQIPFIEERIYPAVLAGPLYPEGIPIYPEETLPELIVSEDIDEVVFAYSDISFAHIMTLASITASHGADFTLLGPEKTMIESTKPVISVCAVRTGCGKSGITRLVAKLIKEKGKNPVVIRHPMPYGDLQKARVQRFTTMTGIKAAGCTIEEMEEYEPLVEAGFTVYAGVDYEEILKMAEEEGEFIVWDGGNNDLPFIKPDLEIVLTDALRPGDELGWWPGEANLRRAGIVVINKAKDAPIENITCIIHNVKKVNPGATIIKTSSDFHVDGPEAEAALRGKRALVIEDGPTVTHGGMGYGAGFRAAERFGAGAVDVRPHAVGTIRETFVKYPHLKNVLPAMGYSREQIKDLEDTVKNTPADVVLVATPVNLLNVITIDKPAVRVTYEVTDMEEPGLAGAVRDFIKGIE